MVRVNAAKEHIRKNKHRRTGSAIQLRPIQSSHDKKQHIKGSKSQSQFKNTERHSQPEVDYEIDE